MKIILLLPMKGNSERVPNKNLRTFAGRPLYHAIFESLRDSKYINEFVINTDSEVIKKDAIENFPGVVIVDRPAEIQGDFVPMNDVISYDLSMTDGDVYIQTHSTNPLLLASSLDKAIETFLEKREQYDSVFSVTRIQSRLYWKGGEAINHNPKELLRTQDLPPVYDENSNFYIFTKESFKNSNGKRIGVKPMMFEIDKIEAVDIDEPQDFIIAEALYKQLRVTAE
jgi:CMP-N-acetylneuraminic acid synthetase